MIDPFPELVFKDQAYCSRVLHKVPRTSRHGFWESKPSQRSDGQTMIECNRLGICSSTASSPGRQSNASTVSFMQPNHETKLIALLLARLERVSVDSYWAHRASGIRGHCLRLLKNLRKEHSQSRLTTNELIPPHSQFSPGPRGKR